MKKLSIIALFVSIAALAVAIATRLEVFGCPCCCDEDDSDELLEVNDDEEETVAPESAEEE